MNRNGVYILRVDLMRSEMSQDIRMFTCTRCKHWHQADNPAWSTCYHPAAKELHFYSKNYHTLTDEEWAQLDHLVFNVLKLKLCQLSRTIPNFEFPKQYEDIWIDSCGAIEEK